MKKFLHIGGSLNKQIIHVPCFENPPERYSIPLHKEKDYDYTDYTKFDREEYRLEKFQAKNSLWIIYVEESLTIEEAIDILIGTKCYRVREPYS